MGDYSGTLRNLGIVHIIVGILLFICGIGDRFYGFFWMRSYYFGIWIGIVMMITGFLGISAGRNKRPCPSCAFLFFALVSSLLGLGIAAIYGLSISALGPFVIFFPLAKAVSYGMILLGVIEAVIGLWATVCSCLMCCASPPQAQEQNVVYKTGNDFVLMQGPDGAPMAVPVQGRADGSTLQGSFTGPQNGQPQMMPIPVPGYQSQNGNVGLNAGQLSTLEAQALYHQLKPMPPYEGVPVPTYGDAEADTTGGIVAGYPLEQNKVYPKLS
ncbi:hypothetical protein ACROYT_G029864 [Oculina patagonica]